VNTVRRVDVEPPELRYYPDPCVHSFLDTKEPGVSDPDPAALVEQLRAHQAQTDQSLMALANAIETIAEQVKANPTTSMLEGMRLREVRHVTTTVRKHHQDNCES
jgi:phytoene dehydrogenase-like protein